MKTTYKKRKKKAISPNTLLTSESQVAKACGVGRWTITAIKKASRGMPDNPWSGRYTTKSRIENWIFAHPEFRAYKVMRKPAKSPDAETVIKVA